MDQLPVDMEVLQKELLPLKKRVNELYDNLVRRSDIALTDREIEAIETDRAITDLEIQVAELSNA